jgi:hypothetical protein
MTSIDFLWLLLVAAICRTIAQVIVGVSVAKIAPVVGVKHKVEKGIKNENHKTIGYFASKYMADPVRIDRSVEV